MRELTPLPLIVGTLLGMVFGASSLYLVLKVGLTVSASIPVAVLSITVFRLLSKFGTARRDDPRKQHRSNRWLGGRIDRVRSRRDHAGNHDPRIRSGNHARDARRHSWRSPRYSHDDPVAPRAHRRSARALKYPEGTACAEVLKAAAAKEPIIDAQGNVVEHPETASGGQTIFTGFGIGFLYQAAMGAFKTWKDTVRPKSLASRSRSARSQRH